MIECSTYAINSEFRLPLIQSREILGREISVMWLASSQSGIHTRYFPSHLQIHWLHVDPHPANKSFQAYPREL